MDILAVILLWPFIILAAGLAFVALFDVFDATSAGGALWWIPIIFFIVLIFVSRRDRRQNASVEKSTAEQIYIIRKVLVISSISLLFPIFIRYLVDATNESVVFFIVGLIIGFAFLVWGIFAKRNTAIMYSNIIGGALTIIYLYTQLWELGEGPRVIAAAFGLLVAVGISFMKLKDKLS